MPTPRGCYNGYKALDISMKRRDCSVNSNYTIILVGSPILSITPRHFSEENDFCIQFKVLPHVSAHLLFCSGPTKLKLLSTPLCFWSFDQDSGVQRGQVTCSGPTGVSGRRPHCRSRTFSPTLQQQLQRPMTDPDPKQRLRPGFLGRREAGKPEVGGGAERRVELCP